MASPQQFCRRKYRTLGLIVSVAGLFYLLQCISVTQLGKISGKHVSMLGKRVLDADKPGKQEKSIHHKPGKLDKSIHPKSEETGKLPHVRVDDGVDREETVANVNDRDGRNSEKPATQSKVGSRDKGSEAKEVKSPSEHQRNPAEKEIVDLSVESKSKNRLVNTRGILPSDLHLYKTNNQGLFTCLHATHVS